MATPRRHTVSGAVGVACLLGLTAGIGMVPAAAQAGTATSATSVVPDACPGAWPVLRREPAGGSGFDGNVSVLVGGNLRVGGGAEGAEGLVVVAGDAAFARAAGAAYDVGVSAVGSQVTPHPDSDMLVVGGNLAAATPIDVGRGLAGDVAVGGSLAAGSQVELHGGTTDVDVPAPTAPYATLLAGLGARSDGAASFPATGTVDLTDTSITLTGDGSSETQVFSVDGGEMGPVDRVGRTLQLVGVPAGATVIVNLTGPAVELAVDELLDPDGRPVDPFSDGYFANLSTHLLWNAPDAANVEVSGQAQLPGSLLVPAGRATTTLAGGGTNGRVLVGGDLVHVGSGGMHSYPFLASAELACGPELAHASALTLDVVLDDPDGVVDRDRFFGGEYSCRLDGEDVGSGTWQLRAKADTRIIADLIPVGALCTLTERLDVPPAPGWEWQSPEIGPDKVRITKRQLVGFNVTNRTKANPPPPAPPPPVEPTPTPDPTPTPTPTPTPEPEPSETIETPSTIVEPTNGPELPAPSTVATPEAEPTDAADDDEQVSADAPPTRGGAPLATTAPYTLAGAFVWGPVLLLSVLLFVVRFPRLQRRRRLTQ